MLIIHLVRFAAQYRTLVCCLLLMWAIVTILGTLYLTSWSKLVLSSSSDHHYTDIRQLLRSRTLFNVHNPKIARALKYCNPMYGDGAAEEGLGIPGSTLEAVVVVTRHGDRGPIQDFVNLTSIDCSVNRTHDPDYEEFLAKVRSSRRSPRDAFLRFSPFPQTGNSCQPGQLSELGALQQLRTGRLLRRAYSDVLFTSPQSSSPTSLPLPPPVVVSTLYERTYQSAVAFMYGLVPEFHLAKVTFKAGLSTSLCYSHVYCRCPLVERLHASVEREKSDHLSSHPAVQNLLQRLTAVLQRGRGRRYATATEARPETVLDQLLAYVCHRAALPCLDKADADGDGDEASCITGDHLGHLVSFVEWRGKILARSQRVKLLSRLSAQGLFVDILDKLQARRRRHGSRVALFSAHDVTLMPLLVALGVYDGIRPPYSSRLVLELYSRRRRRHGHHLPANNDTAADSIFHLKVLYNGRDVTRRVTFCEKQQQQQQQQHLDNDLGSDWTNVTVTDGSRRRSSDVSVCTLDSFSRFVNEDFLREMNVSHFQQACMVDSHK